MKPGISETSIENLKTTTTLDPFGADLRDFQTTVAIAQHNRRSHDERIEIEAAQKIIDHFNPNGVGPAGFFIFHGVYVYPEGRTAEIKAQGSEQIGKRLHGIKEGDVVGT